MKSIINHVVDELSKTSKFDEPTQRMGFHVPTPSVSELDTVLEVMRGVIFPGYFGTQDVTAATLKYHLGASLDQVYDILLEQTLRGYCFICEQKTDQKTCTKCKDKAEKTVEEFFKKIPVIRHMLSTDVQAAFEGDPAAKSPSEAIFCYPSIRALLKHRIAHELFKLEVPLIPRIISESAHADTGIDIHPGATIGEKFFMDHGTGIVIGETTIIGNNVRLYQGVTLGAKSFPLDQKGHPIKGIPRHPIIEDDVIIYAGATILGRITIGKNSTIGGNIWITEDVPPYSKLTQK